MVIAWGLAKGFKNFVARYNYDTNFYSLRNINYWFYVFSGRYLEGEGVQGTQAGTDLIILDVLTNSNIIYSGILLDFNYSPERDELENVILDSTYKRNFEKNKEEENPEHSTDVPTLIPGDAFVIPMSTNS